MELPLSTLQDWRYAGSVALIGALIGQIIYKKIPAPAGSQEHFEKMLRAHLAGATAKQAGAKPVAFMADVVGAHAAGQLNQALQRQRRKCLIWSLLLTAVALLPAFAYLPLSEIVPTWGFAIIAVFGVFRIYKLW